MTSAIIFEAERTAYNIDQLTDGYMDKPITVGELKRLLEDFDDDTMFILSHDNGYTYGSITADDVRAYEYDEECGKWARTW